MKKSTGIFLLILLSSTFAFSQKKEPSEFSVYAYKPTPQDRLIIEMNHTGWLGMPKGLKEKPTAGGVNIQLFFDYPLGKSRFSFAWGLGLSSHNIHGPINLVYKTDSITGSKLYTSIEERKESYRVNRIAFKIIEVPVEFRIRTRTNYQFKCMIGFKAGYVVQTFRTLFDKNGKIRTYDIYGVNPLRYGPTIRMGWEQIHITAFYSLSEVFQKNKGEKGIIPFSIGFAYTPRIGIGRK